MASPTWGPFKYRNYHPDAANYAKPLNQYLTLDKAESHHLLRVLRAPRGAAVSVFDGRGTELGCCLVGENQGAELQVINSQVANRRRSSISWVQALPKGKIMEQAIRQTVEIGIDQILPVTAAHTEGRPRNRAIADSSWRWRSAAIEACKQSGNSWLPAIEATQPFTRYLSSIKERTTPSLYLIASLNANAKPLHAVIQRAFVRDQPANITFMVGPEGDFSAEEYQAAIAAGALPVRLANNVLRVETAVLYILSVIDNWLNKESSYKL